jgi:hypothetical protein
LAWTKPYHIASATRDNVVNKLEQVAAILSADWCFHDGAAVGGDARKKTELIDDILKFHGIAILG